MDKNFFNEALAQSAVKARIVSKYFHVWGQVMAPRARAGRIAYIDLFSGPGRYNDGTRSTPLLVLEKAISHAGMRELVVPMFNDYDEDNVHALKDAIEHLPGIERLKHPPQIYEAEVDAEIAKAFGQAHLVPTFSFIDPWGYKGLSLPLIHSVIKDWGCDSVFFFNYRRINMAINNDGVRRHIDALLGAERVDRLRATLSGFDSEQRERAILQELTEAIRALGGTFVLTFRFRAKGGDPSHHLVFVSKDQVGYQIMKDIMDGESLKSHEDVPLFEFSLEREPGLLRDIPTLAVLRAGLLTTFSRKEIKMVDVFKQHNPGTPFVSRNYKRVLLDLEKEGIIRAKSDKRRVAGKFGDEVRAIFP